MPVIPALRWLRQEGHELKASLGYVVQTCLRNSSTEDLYSHAPHSTAQRNPVRQPVFKRTMYLLPSNNPANGTRKIWADLGLPLFPYLCQCSSRRLPFLPVLEHMSKMSWYYQLELSVWATLVNSLP